MSIAPTSILRGVHFCSTLALKVADDLHLVYMNMSNDRSLGLSIDILYCNIILHRYYACCCTTECQYTSRESVVPTYSCFDGTAA